MRAVVAKEYLLMIGVATGVVIAAAFIIKSMLRPTSNVIQNAAQNVATKIAG